MNHNSLDHSKSYVYSSRVRIYKFCRRFQIDGSHRGGGSIGYKSKQFVNDVNDM